MVMGVSEPQFPFDNYVDRKTKQSGKYIAGQELGELGGMIPQLIQFYQKQKAMKDLQSALQQQGQPQQGPPLPGVGMPGMPQPASGVGAPSPDQTGNIISSLMEVDPTAGSKMLLDQAGQTQAFAGPYGQFSSTKKPGFSPFGKVDRWELMRAMAGAQEKGASLQEKAKEAEMNRQLRAISLQIQQDLAAGKHDDALARLETVRAAINERAIAAKRTARVNAQKENAKYWFRNPVTVPADPDTQESQVSDGWTIKER